MVFPEFVKLVVEVAPDSILEQYKKLLLDLSFPKIWKEALLVLIEKEKKGAHVDPSYRPICLLNILGKLYERLINERVMQEVNRMEGLNQFQFGFIKNRDTVDAPLRVRDIVEFINTAPYNRRELCVLVTLDVKNAFNTARWDIIIDTLERKRISKYLTEIIKSYLENRIVQWGKVVP